MFDLRKVSLLLTLAPLAAAGRAQRAPLPLTTAESSGWEHTSSHAEMLEFLAALRELPSADRLVFSSLCRSGEGRDIAAVIAAEPRLEDATAVMASGKLRILVNANIHGGEVEGKEATQILLRELAMGRHAELLERVVLMFVPDFNADGNDAMKVGNRPGQNGPDPVGRRHNAADLDLNRDFVKAASTEVTGLLAAFRDCDPHVFMDLHTTNGSYHGYHLTYAPSLSTNIDATLDQFARATFLPEIRKAMLERHGFRVFHYGTLSRRGPRRWTTYDHRPRFGTNYYGLRNRLAVLSEAYSYLDFERRAQVTRAFVLENIRAAARHADAIRALCAAADARLTTPRDDVTFGFDTALASPVEGEVLVGSVDKVEGPEGTTRLVASEKFRAETMPTQLAFRSAVSVALPAAWLLPEPEDRVVALLAKHGIVTEVVARELTVAAEVFVPDAVRRSNSRYAGPSLEITGSYQRRPLAIAAGALLVRSRQRLARLAAQLLEPQSEDSFATWGLFGERVLDPEAAAGEGALRFPVVRLAEIPADLR